MRSPSFPALHCWWLLLFAATPAAGQTDQFQPPRDDSDWVQLVSGEWLKGEIIGLFNDYLEFDSEILDDLKIELEDVSQIISPRTMGVRIQGAGLMVGKVLVNESDVIVRFGDRESAFDRDQLVSLTLSSERELDRWSGELTFGTNVRRGNTDVLEYNTIAGLERRTPLSRAFIDYIGNFNETEGVRVSDNHRVNVVLDRFSESRFFWRPFSGQYFRDPFQNIRNQTTLETGAGYELINTNETEWEITAGAGVNIVERVSVETDQEKSSTSPSVSLGTAFETELTSWMDYLLTFQMTFVDKESGEYQHHLLTTLSTDLIGDIDFDVSLVWDRVQQPPPNAQGETPERNDYRMLVGVSWDF
jgi:hypothetical protein